MKEKLSFQVLQPKTILLVGMMGSGKTSVGRLLSRFLDLPFVDSDKEIEKVSHCSISDLFACYGEEEFRKGEERVMERLMKGTPCILSSGGGAFLSEKTRELSKKYTLSVWIKANADVLAARTQGKKHRPLIPAEDNKQAIQKLIEKSYPFYALADMMVESCQEPPVQTVRKIIRLLQQSHFIQEL
jgi:shikimate kinase